MAVLIEQPEANGLPADPVKPLRTGGVPAGLENSGPGPAPKSLRVVAGRWRD